MTDRIKSIREALARADRRNFRGGGLLRAFDTVIRYARARCWEVGHVRTGVGDTDICSRCGEPVNDEIMAASLEHAARLARIARLPK